MLACRVENLFGENDYFCGKMKPYVITVDGINYLPLDDVKKLGFIYELEDIEKIEYQKQSQESKNKTLAISYENIFGRNDYECEYDELSIERNGIRYLTLDTLRKTDLTIMPCDLQEVEI